MLPASSLLLALLMVTTTSCLQLLDIRVPQFAELYDSVTLSCEFDLAGGKLYSVKWYKDDFEFFRYIPDNTPPSSALPLPGIHVELSLSNMTTLRLTKLSFSSTGSYRCEVSMEAPKFDTVMDSRNMTVRALPREGPLIEGILSSYSVGDYVSGNCTSHKSNPPASLAWHINGIQVEPWFLEHFSPADEPDKDGLYSRALGLRFQLDKRHFNNPLELKCSATVGGRTWDRVISPGLATLTNQKLAQERLANHASGVDQTWVICCLVIASLLGVLKS